MAIETAPETLISPNATKISFEDFLAKYSDGSHVEWVDGQVTSMTAASLPHVRLQLFLAAMLEQFAKMHHLGEVVLDPFIMRTGTGLPGRAPDIAFVRDENAIRLRHTFIDGPADLVVEIVSPDDPERDYVTKFREYETGGVAEYWIVDPRLQRVEFYQWREGKFHAVFPDDSGIYHSAQMTGLWIKPAWLWQEPLPDLIQILREWKLI